jgi:hypothetical protein
MNVRSAFTPLALHKAQRQWRKIAARTEELLRFHQAGVNQTLYSMNAIKPKVD